MARPRKAYKTKVWILVNNGPPSMVFCAHQPIKLSGPGFPLNNSLYRAAKKCLPADAPGGKPLCELLHDLG